jgi:hypothetical protein
MNDTTKNIVKCAIDNDNTMTEAERAEVMAFLTLPRLEPQEPDRLLTFKEAGAMLSVHEKTVWCMVRQGRLHVVPISAKGRRVRLSEIKKLMEEGVAVNRSYCPTRERAS